MMSFEKGELCCPAGLLIVCTSAFTPEQTQRGLTRLNAALKEVAPLVKSAKGVHGDFSTVDDSEFPIVIE